MIDLNIPGAWTPQSALSLLQSKTDARHRQVRLSDSGIVELSDWFGNQNLAGTQFRLETFCAGNGYCGPSVTMRFADAVYWTVQNAWVHGDRGLADIFDDGPR
ncbi:MAG: hypothetical protein U1E28_18715 [Beijerinckiaceae bacterium]